MVRLRFVVAEPGSWPVQGRNVFDASSVEYIPHTKQDHTV